MLIQKNTLRKLIMAASIVVMSIGFSAVSSFNANATDPVDNEELEPAPGVGDRYQAVGEDGANLCFCNTSGKKCKCM